MFAIIYPICALPLIFAVFIAHRRAKKNTSLESYKTPFESLGAKKLAVALFWQLDVIGIILMIAVLALILVPFSIAGGVKTTWGTAKVIAPLVIGILCIPVFAYWESTCQHPIIPFHVSNITTFSYIHLLTIV
jgi:SIT family siderophore-iron:H+ symporter-like MFS transporter